MASTGYVLNGKYYKRKPQMKKLVRVQQTMFKQGDHARQRFDHSAEILQPYTLKGEPNPKFIEAYPDAAADYGFLPSREKGIDPLGPSDTPMPDDPNYGGSRPWGV